MLIRVMDVLRQIYVRKGQILGLDKMRQNAIAEKKQAAQK
jgi:hypothetical protein